MKILVGYDGSSYADVAIDDLQWAGLPEQADVIVLTAVEWPLQAPRSWGMVETGFEAELEGDIKAAASPAGHASNAILEKARDWPADLIVAGTHGRSALARVVLGSVSQKLVREAPCSVRIA